MAKKHFENRIFRFEVIEDINTDTDVFFGFKNDKKVEIAQALVQYFKENRKEANMLKRFLELAEIEANKEILEVEMV